MASRQISSIFAALPNEILSIILHQITSFETLKNLLLAYPPLYRPLRAAFDRIIASIRASADFSPFFTLIVRVTVMDCKTKGAMRQAAIRTPGKDLASALIEDSFWAVLEALNNIIRVCKGPRVACGCGISRCLPIRRFSAKDETTAPTEELRIENGENLTALPYVTRKTHRPNRRLARLSKNLLVAGPALFFPLADAHLTGIVDSIAQYQRLSVVRTNRLHQTVRQYDIILAVDAERSVPPMYIGREFSPGRMRAIILALRGMCETSNEVVCEEFETWRAYTARVEMLRVERLPDSFNFPVFRSPQTPITTPEANSPLNNLSPTSPSPLHLTTYNDPQTPPKPAKGSQVQDSTTPAEFGYMGYPTDPAALEMIRSARLPADMPVFEEDPEAQTQASNMNDQPTEPNADITYPPMGFGKHKPKMLLMGLKKSGKTSISNVVLRKMTPQQTLFLHATTTINKQSMAFMDFQIWDLPGQIDYLDGTYDASSIFGGVGGIIWVIDVQDNYMQPIQRLTDTIVQLTEHHPDIKYFVFIHKTDSLTDDYREDTIRDIVQKITDGLFDEGLENPPVNYYPTSIFDHTIFEAFSKVIQGLVPQLPTYEALLNSVSASCRFQKVYIVDVMSKVFIAEDTSPSHTKTYELCCDFIDFIMDISDLYSFARPAAADAGSQRAQDIASQTAEAQVRSFRGFTIYLREVNAYVVFRAGDILLLTMNDSFLSLIGVSREPDFDNEKAMVDYNVQIFQDKLLEVIERG
ncbi:MAG: hypothetical protein Q9212_005508 [Teloschistes hypoglaucus]